MRGKVMGNRYEWTIEGAAKAPHTSSPPLLHEGAFTLSIADVMVL
jgi:hypothetical protein